MKPSNSASTHRGEQLCQIILKSIHKYRCYGLAKSRRMDICMHPRVYKHQNAVVTTVALTASGLDKNQACSNKRGAYCISLIHDNQQIILTLFPNKPWFLRVCSSSLLKTLCEKEKLLIASKFSFSHCVFDPFGELFAIFIQFEIFVCKLFQFERV